MVWIIGVGLKCSVDFPIEINKFADGAMAPAGVRYGILTSP